MSTTKKNLIDMSLDEIIKTNKKKGGFKVGMKKKGNVKKTSQIAKVANKSKGIRKSKVGLKNPVEAARKRTQIAAATLTAKRRLNKFGVKNIVDKGAIRAIVAEVLKSKTLNRIKVPKRKLTNNSVTFKSGNTKIQKPRFQANNRFNQQPTIRNPSIKKINQPAHVNIFKSRLIAHKFQSNQSAGNPSQGNRRLNEGFNNKNGTNKRFNNRNDRRPNRRVNNSFNERREHPTNFLKRDTRGFRNGN